MTEYKKINKRNRKRYQRRHKKKLKRLEKLKKKQNQKEKIIKGVKKNYEDVGILKYFTENTVAGEIMKIGQKNI